MFEEMPLTLGRVFLILLLVLIVFIIVDYKVLKDFNEWRIALVLLGAAMWMCTKDFPYEMLANKWEVFRFLSKNIQFPWRFLTMVSLFSAWLCLLILTKVEWKEIGERYKELVICGLMLVLILDASNMIGRVMSEKGVMLIFSSANLRSTNVMQGEYLYEGIDETDYVNEITDIGKDLELLNWQREKGGLLVEVVNKGSTDNTLELPLIFYKGYEAYDAVSKQRMELSVGKSHRIQLHLNAGYSGRVNIEFVEPWYWRIAEAISFVSCFIVAIKLFLLCYKKEDAA